MATADSAGCTFNHLDPTATANEVRTAYTEMRESCPVVHSDRYGGFDFITRYADVRAALGDSDSFSSADGVFIPPNDAPPVPALEFDDPEHAAWRALLDGPLSPSAVHDLEPTLAEIADRLIDKFAAAGSADLVPAFAEPLPAIVIGRMVGLDHEQAVQARAIAAALFASVGTETFPQRMGEFAAYTLERLAERRSAPRDDFLSEMATGVVGGMEIDDEGAIGLMVAYLIGGHHSTASALAGLIRHVLSVPGLRLEVVRDPRVMMRVVEESLRLSTPLQLFARTTRRPVQLGDQELSAGGRVMLNLASANRDPREFDDPDAFDAHRKRNRHLAFGAGTHSCQGQHLARAELRIAAKQLFERLPDIRVSGEPVESGLVAGTLMTLHSLPVSFTPA